MVAINPETGERKHGTATSDARRIFENLKLLPPFTIASAMNPSAANGSISGQTAAKWCELRIATAEIPCRRAFSRSSGALARKAGCAKPFAASVATSPGAASVTTGTARPSTQPLFSVET